MKKMTLGETMRRAALIASLCALTTPALAQTDLGRWITRAPLPTPRQEMPHVFLDGMIYVVGGILESRAATNVMEVYDPARDLWSPAKALPVSMHHLGVATANGKLYVLGGYFGNSFNAGNRVFEYDPATDTWRTMEPMPVPRHGIGAVAVADTIFIIGGGPRAGFAVTDDNSSYVPPTPTPTAITAEAPLPDGVVVYQNHPNPFSSRTTIRFAISRPAAVTLTIYDLLGRAVTTLIRGRLPAGKHRAAWHADDHPNGVYLYRLTADGFATTKSLVVLR